MDEDSLEAGLQTLSELLFRHYGQKTIILIDEYDVPLDKAYQHGYYREMTALIRALFGEALNTNIFLQFAVLTGCLRVSKESIFMGLNNFKILSITDSRFDEQFGFTEKMVIVLVMRISIVPGMSSSIRRLFGETRMHCQIITGQIQVGMNLYGILLIKQTSPQWTRLNS